MLGKTLVVILGTLSLALAGRRPAPKSRYEKYLSGTWPTSFTVSASAIELQYQPMMHFADGACYNTAAITPGGEVHRGGSTWFSCPSDGCREAAQLRNNNVYSRMRCNNGYCAIMYDYYFPKDQTVCGSWGVGHNHDWENVVVFVHMGRVVRVAPSAHGNYHGARDEFYMPKDGHPAVVYHRDRPGGTHSLRLGTARDEYTMPKHPDDTWFRGALVGWEHWPTFPDYRKLLLEGFTDKAKPKFVNTAAFEWKLEQAAEGRFPEFDPHLEGDLENPFGTEPEECSDDCPRKEPQEDSREDSQEELREELRLVGIEDLSDEALEELMTGLDQVDEQDGTLPEDDIGNVPQAGDDEDWEVVQGDR